MRFLIFNITVLAALGFLFTSAPNQSFPQWALATLNLWAEPNETTGQENQLVDAPEPAKRFAKVIADESSDIIKAIDSLVMVSDDSVAERQVVSGGIQPVSPDQPKPQLQPQLQPMSYDAIKDVIIAVIDEQREIEAHIGAQQDKKEVKPAAISQLKKPEVKSKANIGDFSRPDEKQEFAEMNDDEIATAFEAFEKSAVNSLSPGLETAFETPITSELVEPTKPNFMTPSQRSADLVQMIESLNLIYFEKTGI